MKTWPSYKISDLIQKGYLLAIQDGNHGELHPKASDYVIRGERIPFIMANDIRANKIDLINCKFIPKSLADKLRIGFAKAGDVLLTHKGTIGEVAIVPNNKYPYLMLTPQVTYYRVNEEKLSSKYLSCYFRSPIFQEKFKNFNGQSTRSYIGITAQKQLSINIPDLNDQKAISSIISTYDELIQVNEKRMGALEEIIQRLYAEWFIKLRFPGYEEVSMVDSGTKFGFIPEGWEIKKLGEVCDYIARGISPKYDEHAIGVVINQKCIRNQKIDLKESRHQSKLVSKEKIIRFGDILINSTGVGTLGRVAQVYSEYGNCTVDSHVSIVRPSSSINVDYFGMILLSLEEYFTRMGLGATGQTELSRGTIQNTPVLVPSVKLQKEFSHRVSSLRELTVRLTEINKNLQKICDLLIPQLVTGKRELKSLDKAKRDKKDVYKDAVLIAEIVKIYNENNFYPNHLRLVKTEYFVQRFINQNPLQKYQEHMLGPYNPQSTYAGGEKVSKTKRYIEKKGSNFYVGTKIQEADKYFKNEKTSVGAVVDYLKVKTNDDLELLATVDYVIYKKLLEKTKPTVQIILDYIHNSSVWEQKIKRLSITQEKVEEIMQILRDFAQKGLPYPSL